MVKSGSKLAKKTSKARAAAPRGRAVAAKAGAGSKAKSAASRAKPASRPTAAKSASGKSVSAKSASAKSGKAKSAPVKATSKSRSAKTAAKPEAASKPRKRSRSGVKVGSFGGVKPGSFGFNGQPGGLGFLAGKPGSAGAAVVDENKPRLTRTKLNTRDLRHFRELLLAKRRQLLGDMETMENEALRVDNTNLSHLPVHMADMGTDNYEQEFTLSLVDRDRQLVDEIDHALKKIDEKTYGICEGTGQMISRERLEAQPWARYGIEYARMMKRPGIRRP